MVTLGKKAPGFSLKGVLQGKVSDYCLESYKGKWLVLFFYPAHFPFISPPEVIAFTKFARASPAAHAEILGVSVASIDSHRKWAEELGGVEYPLLSDENKEISRAYGVLDEQEGVCLRATVVINAAGEVSYLVVSHTNVGRSVEETLRVLKALRTERLCPSDWKPGEPTGELKLKY